MEAVELTSREQDILNLICEGLPNRAIADKLFLSIETVKWYNKQIFSKLEVSNRTQATLRVQEWGLLPSATSHPVEPSLVTPHNLPTPLTSFVGRIQELEDLTSLLATSRLVTVTGTGGIGKTRLALAFARSQLHIFPDGVYFVSLADISKADDILFAIAEAFGFQFQRGAEPLRQLQNYLQQRQMLFILDNFEHLVSSANIVAQFLRSTEAICFVVTSREPLKLYGEAIYRVHGLNLSQSSDNMTADEQSEAVELFINRARAVRSPFKPTSSASQQQLLAQICELVEGMPLAIELAATWIDTLQLSEIVDEITQNLDFLQSEIRDAHAGHHSIRATFLRSWVLLDDPQQMAFRRIAVFRGSFNREAAQAIADVHYATLKALVMKSLLYFEPDQGRYQLHQLLHQFAYEKLEEHDETGMMQERHAAYFTAFADQQWQGTKGKNQYAALNKIETDIENIRAAWGYWTDVKNTIQLKHLFHAVWVIYDVSGWYPAGVQLLQDTIETIEALEIENSEAAANADTKACLGWLTAVKGMFVVARSLMSREGYDLCRQGVSILRELDQPYQNEYLLVPLLGLFKTAMQVNEPEIALECSLKCLELATEIQNLWGIVKAHHMLALMAIDNRNYERANQLAHTALEICKTQSDYWSESVLCIEVLATIAIYQKQYQQAQQWLEQGLAAATSIDYVYVMRAAYFQLGYVAILSNNYPESARYWNKALAISHQVSLGTTGFLGKAIAGDYPVPS
jgi:predicted ATPase/DNA-binding CsgD family transcriptional regulator